jgi:cytochrome c biogenesis protein
LTLWFLLAAVVLAAAFLKGFRKWLSSMSGAVWILVALTVMSLLGVMIGQNLPPEAYTERYGDAVGGLVYRAGLTDIFTSWYFLGLSAVLAASLLACSAGRLRKLARARGRGWLSRAGSLLLHVALVVIIAGGVVTAVFGFRHPAPFYLIAGDEMEIEEGGFAIRVDAASTEFSDDGVVSEYYSDVAVIEDGEEVRSQRIEVNHPLVHNGVGLYQHEMLPAATSVREVLFGIVMMTDEGDSPITTIAVPFQEEYTLPGTDVTLEVLEFLADFTYDIQSRTATLASLRHRNPAVKVRISEAGEFVADRWVFADTQAHRDDSNLPCRVFLFDYLPDYENGITRFELSRQPGTPLLFIGFAAMSLGLMLTFWTRGTRKKESPDES